MNYFATYLKVKMKSNLLQVTTSVGLVIAGIAIGWILFADKDSYGMNLWTEAIGVIFTFLILDWWTRKRDERIAEQSEKSRLIRQMKSKVNTETIRAVEELEMQGWLRDGSLNSKNFDDANLQNANLGYASLYDVQFMSTNLKNASLIGANLQGIRSMGANWAGVNFDGANMNGAKIMYASLFGARLVGTDLRGANLSHSDLRYAVLQGTIYERSDASKVEFVERTQIALFDETTILPDGSTWTSATDMAQFTNPEHPHFIAPNTVVLPPE